MKVTYGQETDTLTIRFKDEHISESDELQEGIIADLNSQGKIVGLEILDASNRITEPRITEPRITEPQNMTFKLMGHPVAG